MYYTHKSVLLFGRYNSALPPCNVCLRPRLLACLCSPIKPLYSSDSSPSSFFSFSQAQQSARLRVKSHMIAIFERIMSVRSLDRLWIVERDFIKCVMLFRSSIQPIVHNIPSKYSNSLPYAVFSCLLYPLAFFLLS